MLVAAAEESLDDRHAPAFILLQNEQQARELRESLLHLGHRAVIVDDRLIPETSLPGAVRALQLANVTAITARHDLTAATLTQLREVAGDAFFADAAAAQAWLENKR